MRHISKTEAPNDLGEWINLTRARAPQNLTYDAIPGEIKDKIRTSLLREQRWLCAYTMIALRDESACHIEHLLAQSTHPAEQVKYTNMTACYPGSQVNSKGCGYGAHAKAGCNIDEVEFVSPLSPSCEARFEYRNDGTISGIDPAAISTVKLLKLDHPALRRMRAAAVKAAGFTNQADNVASIQEARAFLKKCKSELPSERLPEFCVALAQIGQRYIEKKEGRQKYGHPANASRP